MRKHSATYYLLTSLVPYTDANLRLSYTPSSFFRELTKRSKHTEASFRTAYSRSLRSGLVELNSGGIPCLTPRAIKLLAPYQSKTLPGAELLVIFDIPESKAWKRSKLRIILRSFQFNPIQKSVWATKLDCKQYVLEAIQELSLSDSVQIYEAKQL